MSRKKTCGFIVSESLVCSKHLLRHLSEGCIIAYSLAFGQSKERKNLNKKTKILIKTSILNFIFDLRNYAMQKNFKFKVTLIKLFFFNFNFAFSKRRKKIRIRDLKKKKNLFLKILKEN